MGIISWILGNKQPKERRHGRFEEADFDKLHEGLVKKVGKIEAEKLLQTQQIQNLKKDISKRDQKILTMSKEKLTYSPFVKRNSLSLFDLIEFSRKKNKIRVLTKDHRNIGQLWDIRMSVMGDTYFFDMITKIKGAKGKEEIKTIMRNSQLDAMFHNPVGFVDAVKNGVLILNRMWDGHYVPDLYTEDGRGVDTAFGEMLNKQEHLEDVASKEKSRAAEERVRRYLEQLGIDASKTTSDITTSMLLASSKTMENLYRELGENKLSMSELHTKLAIMQNSYDVARKSIDDFLEKSKEKIGITDYEKIRDEWKDNMDMFAEQMKKMQDIATPKSITLVQEKKPEPPKLETTTQGTSTPKRLVGKK